MINTTELSREEILLTGLCRLEISSDEEQALRGILERQVRWDLLSGLANMHGVTALVFHNIEKLGLAGSIPPQIHAFFMQASMLSLARNSARMKMVQDVAAITGVKTVLLKGMALELMAYGNTGLRQMNDIDLLVSPGDALKCHSMLMQNGFAAEPLKSPLYRGIMTHIGKHLPSLTKNGISVELHHRLFTEPRLTEEMYSTAVSGNTLSPGIFLPEPSVFFLYLVSHLHSHERNNESQLRLYADLAALTGKYGSGIISRSLLERSCTAGLGETLASKLFILQRIWKINFPLEVKDFIEKNRSSDAMEKFLFFLRSPKNNPYVKKRGEYRARVREIPGFSGKILYVTGDLFPGISFMKKRYRCSSAVKAMMYYPHRWGKLVYLVRG